MMTPRASPLTFARTTDGSQATPLVRSSSERLPVLDGLRGVAILAVMMLHFSPSVSYSVGDKALQRFFSVGWVGVDLFFVLSGFLITGILIDTRRSPNYFRNFYVRRVLRIFPLYYGFLAVVFLVVPMFWTTPSDEYRTVAAQQGWYWLYAVNIAQVLYGHGQTWGTVHLWSLSVEEQFYLLWPAVIWIAPPRLLLRICLASILVAFAARLAIVISQGDLWAASVLTPTRMDSLAIGGIVAVLARSSKGTELLRRAMRPALGVAISILATHIAITHELRNTQPFIASLGLLCNATAAAALLGYALLYPGGTLGRVMASRVLRLVGRYSYGAYVIHLPLREAARPIFDRVFTSGVARSFGFLIDGVWVLAMMSFSLLLAALSFHLFEKHFLQLKERFRAPESVSVAVT